MQGFCFNCRFCTFGCTFFLMPVWKLDYGMLPWRSRNQSSDSTFSVLRLLPVPQKHKFHCFVDRKQVLKTLCTLRVIRFPTGIFLFRWKCSATFRIVSDRSHTHMKKAQHEKARKISYQKIWRTSHFEKGGDHPFLKKWFFQKIVFGKNGFVTKGWHVPCIRQAFSQKMVVLSPSFFG